MNSVFSRCRKKLISTSFWIKFGCCCCCCCCGIFVEDPCCLGRTSKALSLKQLFTPGSKHNNGKSILSKMFAQTEPRIKAQWKRKDGQWLWHSGRLQCQRSAVRFPLSANFLLNIDYCQLYWKDEDTEKEAGNFLKRKDKTKYKLSGSR